MATEHEIAAMRRAIALAARHLGRTSSNPVVGCVLLAPDGRTVGEGAHERAGGPHAEINALRAAGADARDATAVVTLEPCAHTGRTGPCTSALIDAGVRRVVFAVADDDEGAGGAAVLAAAGVDVESGVCAQEAARGNEAWLHGVRTGRPFVTWKYAATLDGRSAAPDGTSRWITGPEARRDVHRLRAQSQAVMVGVGTVLADDPQLTVRDADGPQPLRVVLDADGRTPASARIRDDAAPTLVLTAADVPRGPDGGLDLDAVLKHLFAADIRSVLLEGGPTLAGAFLRAGLVDKVIGYLAPALLGDGPAALTATGIRSIADIRRLRLDDVTRLGDDLRITSYPEVV